MPFKRAFERNVNQELQGTDRSQRPGEAQVEDTNIKKHHDASHSNDEEEDYELSEKKDRPPRFSTLFAGPPAPMVVEREPQRERRSGVFIPMPLFILLVILLFLMSTFLFAYTIIGLYNNRPAGLLDVGGHSPAPIDGCNCADKQAGINIAPNFVMGQAKSTVTVTITASRTAVLPDSKSSNSLNQKSEAKAVASEFQSMLSTLLPSKATTTSKPKNTKVVTVTPPPDIVKSTTLIAVNAKGKTVTLSNTKSAAKASKADNGNKDANNKSVAASVKSGANSNPSHTETDKATTSPSTKDKPTKKDKSSQTEKKDATTKSTKENAAGPTPCNPFDLVDSCQH